MASLARRSRHRTDIWPGFVDALASLLLVIIFLLMVFVLAQFFMGEALSGRETALQKLNMKVSEISDLLSVEQSSNQSLRSDVTRLSRELQTSITTGDRLKGKIGSLTGDVARLKALKAQLETSIGKLASTIKQKDTALLAEKELSKSARAQAALLNQQLSVLNNQIATLNSALGAAEKKAKIQNVQIISLGKRLNAALASKVMELSTYRSEFFGRLAKILGNKPGIKIVGDRFVFQSEVLFASGDANFNPSAYDQLNNLAKTLIGLGKRIPSDIDWVLRIDGHTDRVPISTQKFASNWELSSARAISVVKYLIAHGVPAKRLVAAGFAQYDPVTKGSSAADMKRNRRIELKLTQR